VSKFLVAPNYQPLVRETGLDADAIFERDDIKPWRTLPDRENCVLDAGGTRLHIKRFKTLGAEDEVRGIELLDRAGIPTVRLVGWGAMSDGRSFVVTLDLKGYRDSEKLVQSGTPFRDLLEPTAHLAAQLHEAGLHHRDLYLCHFFTRLEPDMQVALIDAARVKPLPRFFRQRWIVKDLAQFWYSTTNLAAVSDAQREAWLVHYAGRRGKGSIAALRRAVVRKSNWIARHDRSLRAKQPTRNVSLPAEGPPG
jgi:hypothetical protein